LSNLVPSCDYRVNGALDVPPDHMVSLFFPFAPSPATDDNNPMKSFRLLAAFLLAACTLVPALRALEKQPASIYHARRMALAANINGGIAILFAAEEPLLDLTPYRQDEDFYYLTGWTEPGAALLVTGDSQSSGYKEILFLPTRDLRMEKYTGVKLDSSSPGVAKVTGVDVVEQMTDLPAALNALINQNRRLATNLWTQPAAPQAKALVDFTAATFGTTPSPTHDVTIPTAVLRVVKDEGEIDLIRKATEASIAGQRVMMRVVKPGVTERTVAGQMTAAWMQAGCERASYAPIVGSGINSTILHYAENSRTMQDGDIVVIDAACEYSMYAADITRSVPANGHFTARQREIYNIVLGAQQAAIDAFVSGKSTINDRDRRDPNSLDTAAYNYINTHGKDLHGQPLGQYWLHGLGHMIGIDVHDPATYPAVLKPGMVFTIEPGVYIPDEKLGIRIECNFLVGLDGKLIDLDATLAHSADEVEAAMSGK
jgi:Xaa-Pro aminopeptidase